MKIKTGLGARFKIIVRNSKTNKINQQSSWFNNMVLDAGLNRMSQSIWFDRCCVGTGTSEPLASDTGLTSFLLATTNRTGTAQGSFISEQPYYTYIRNSYRFDVGTVIGTISEVGLGWDNSKLWNKALLKDSNGNLTPLTVTVDDYIDVFVEIRFYFTEFISSINLKNIDGSVASTHTLEGKIKVSAYPATAYNFKAVTSKLSISSSSNFLTINSPIASQIYFEPSGSHSYPDLRSVKGTYSIPKNIANSAHSLLIIGMEVLENQPNDGGYLNGYQVKITPPIQKTATMQLQHSFTLSWARRII